MKIHWSSRALERVHEIARYIAQDSPEAAHAWMDSLFARVGTQLRSSRSGRMVPEFGRSDLRELVCGNYRVIYRLGPDGVDVLTVRHARRRMRLDELEQ